MVFTIFVKPLLVLISHLPFRLLYALSDTMYVLVYKVMGYRRSVVSQNLLKSFPNKTPSELKTLEKAFYRWFCDVMLETIKLYSISPAAFKQRCTISDASLELIHQLEKDKRSYIGALGHTGNWEWSGVAHQLYLSHKLVAVYHPLTHTGMDRFMIKLRTRFGGTVVPMQKIVRDLVVRNKGSELFCVGLIADQTPPPESAFWLNFLHQDTPVFNGPEKISKKFNLPIVFFDLQRTGRGYYTLHLSLMTESPDSEEEGAISQHFMQLLEQVILKNPEAWLWSHRRWKHARKIIA